MVILYPNRESGLAGSGLSVFLMERSADVLTTVLEVDELLVPSGSDVVLVTTAVFDNGLVVTPELTVVVMVTVAEPPLAMVPRVHGRAVHTPCEGTTLNRIRSPDKTSITTTVCASLGPALLTVNV